MTTAIVPMKGNNQRLPGKNLVSLGDKPLCYWLLGTLLGSDFIDRVVVDVWGTEIIEAVSRMPGAERLEISERPLAYCDPMAGGNRLLERFVEDPSETYVQCHVTSPFLSSRVLETAVSAIANGKAESCFGATVLRQRMWMTGIQGDSLRAVNHDPEGPLLRTQDLPVVYMENGSFFAFTGDRYMRNGNTRNGPDSLPIALEFPETVDIDEPEDLQIARSVITSGLLSS